jgi:hypothetical protein
MKPKLTGSHTNMWSLYVIIALICLGSATTNVQASDYNGNALINVHFDPNTVFTIIDPRDEIELDWSEWSGGIGCGEIEDDRCHEYYNDFPGCQYGGGLDPDIDVVGPESTAPIKIMWVCAVFPDTTCVDVKEVQVSISHVSAQDMLLIDYGVPDDATVGLDREFPDFDTNFIIEFETPRTSHVVPVMWIAVLPNRSGQVFFDTMGIVDSNNEQTFSSFQFTPAAGLGMRGFNPTWPFAIPIERACCTPETGECMISNIADCYAGGGDWQGDQVSCDGNPCPQPPTAACCVEEFCSITIEFECAGDWYADIDSCDPNPCVIPDPIRACCYPDGVCMLMIEKECNGGEWYADEEACEANPCPQPPVRACCFEDGSCELTLLVDCQGDWYAGDEACEPNPCEQPLPLRACCYPDGSCSVETLIDCDEFQGNWYAGDEACEPNPCEQPLPQRVCCFPDGSCSVETLIDCEELEGIWNSDLESCEEANSPCPQPPPSSACCDADGSCLVMTLTDCSLSGGTWYAETGCDSAPCPLPHPCCLPDGSCIMMQDFTCEFNAGIWKAEYNSCDEVLCVQPPEPVAVCCYDATLAHPGSCLILSENECDDVEGTWFTALDNCDGSNPCRLRACCKQNAELVFVCIASMIRFDECEAMDGIWAEQADTCDPNPCGGGGPSAAAPTSWGGIKTLYHRR